MEKQDPSTPKDCLACRILGGSSLLLCSVYVLSMGIRAKTRNAKISSYLFGSSLGYTGVARLLDIFPFGTKPDVESVAST
ncbi:hypothetical protein TNIN_360461 [Trichonephila inaurata madagascariensis]|uniref:Distal membrane-arm assembly complex protein 1-like domain-containing protein n=1 Tax=Trichonephila inaurata madagascariensis TaxID=2747483 RepID=A0A8X6WPR7_9ARAC|nr:hypothetical protein TNIN_360461 [Trichonephila inaurata madagascariensis]